MSVDPDEQPVSGLPRPEVREPAVTRAEVDRDAAREADPRVSESMIRAFETLAADDVHPPHVTAKAHERRESAGPWPLPAEGWLSDCQAVGRR